MPPSRRLLAAIAAVCLIGSTAEAQLPSIDVRTWRPSTDPSASLVLEPPATPGAWSFNVGTWLDYTNRPVALRQGGGPFVLYPVEHLLGNDVTLNLGLGARAAVGLDVPMFFYQEGSAGVPARAVTSSKVPTSGLGDLTLTGKGALVTNEEGGFGLALLGAVSVPTGDRESFMGQGSATVTARALADYSLVVGDLQATLGYTLVTAHSTWLGVRFGDRVPWSLGILLHPGIVRALDKEDRQSWEIAVHGSIPAAPGDPGSQALSPALLALSDRVALGHFRDTYVLVGADIGLTNAIGVPTVRAIASVGWAPRSHDKDRDGVLDDVDQCPDVPEDLDGFEDNDGCPDADDDEDGIPDREDACPFVKGVRDPDPKKNGCPRDPALTSDRDRDGVPDHLDRCPGQPEDRDGFQDVDGCPDPDNDGDGIADEVDACPNVPGEPSVDPSRNGCPNPDHDGDTFDDDVDACPGEPEVFNGVKDEDGCPDVGGRLLVTVDTKDPRLPVRLAAPERLIGGADPAALDASATPTLRALAQTLNLHRDWTLAVGIRPGHALTAEGAMARAASVAREVGRLAHRESAAEPVAWESVARQPGSDSGVALLVLVGAEKPAKPVILRALP